MDTQPGKSERRESQGTQTPQTWARPSVEVICLACEISAYAPDQDGPLF